ncbi:MAG: GNAT family N-acetyltransferase [Gammaproteobacteria bacterium]|nr:GNAT family N-acetyltransferase [Gammaproteobacteria bacterium]
MAQTLGRLGIENLSIRKGIGSDIDALCALSNEINREHYRNMPEDFLKPDGGNQDEPYWNKFLQGDNSIVYVAEKNGVIVGAISASVSSTVVVPFIVPRARCQVETIVVTKKYRGEGIGRMLMSAVEVFAKAKGAADIRLDVMGFNSGAIAFYKELGFGNFSSRLSKSLL